VVVRCESERAGGLRACSSRGSDSARVAGEEPYSIEPYVCMYGMAETTEIRAAFFRGLSDPSRLSLIEELARGDRRVTDLAALTGLAQPNVSRHLACLWDCGLVERERRGPEVH
jgi:Bacterial regulatory protein, arsR family